MINRKIRKFTLIWLASVAASLLVILPAGGEGGLSGSGGMRGAIQRFASVVINDVVLGTKGAVILANGASVTQENLRIGQQVELTASELASNQADTVIYRANIVAPVQSIDVDAETLVVLGQVVEVFTGSHEDGIVFEDISLGEWVEISGQRDNQRRILATYLGSAAGATEIRFVGRVDQPVIGVNLVVDGVAIDANLAIGTPLYELSAGDTVEILGNLGGIGVRASMVSRLAGLELADKDYVDLTGFIDAITETSFELEGLPVSYGQLTTYLHGTADKLESGSRVEVEGSLDNNGVLIATRILFKPIERIEIRAPLEVIDTLSGDLQILGIHLQTTQATMLGAGSSSQYAFGSLEELAVGDYLRVRAFVGGEQYLVSRIDRLEFEEEARLLGFVSNPGNTEVKLLGASFMGDSGTRFELQSHEVSAQVFYAAMRPGDRVRIDWDDLSASPEKIKQK